MSAISSTIPRLLSICLLALMVQTTQGNSAAFLRKWDDTGPKVIFVKQGGQGKGQSWDNAYGDLQQALRAAKKGDQIWVAGGEYKPTTDDDRTKAFELVDQVSVYGGFAGLEMSQSDRNIKANPTILSGEIGLPSREDNSYTVVYAEKISVNTVIDGFIITGGHANANEAGLEPSSCGGGWFNFDASPSISNCVFRNNFAREGGAMFNLAGKGGNSSPRIVNCIFLDNRADLDGGAIFNNGDDGRCMPRVEACNFEQNAATYGAVMMNRANNGLTKVNFCQCKFIRNQSHIEGTGIYNHRTSAGICISSTKDCLFEDYNDASLRLNVGLSTDFDPLFRKSVRPQRLEVDNSWCYASKLENCLSQGRLYTFQAALISCKGRVVPSLDEWLMPLSGYYDDEKQQVVGDPKEAYQQIIGDLDLEALKRHEFMAGQFDGRGFLDQGIAGYFWTSSERNESENYIIYFDTRDKMVHKGWADRSMGLSCICYEKQ